MNGKLTTERLELRPWRAADAADLYALARDPLVGPAAGWAPHRSEAESAEVIRTIFSAPETYAVTLRDGGRLVGCAGLLFAGAAHLALGASEAEAGYWLGTPWRGRGLIPEAVDALARHAFDDLGLTALWACCFPENGASRRVLEKCRFRHVRSETSLPRCPDGTLHGGELFRLSREAWRVGRGVALHRAAEQAIPLIRALASEAFPATYREILTPSQLDYMMEWMYSEESLREQFRAGHVWFIVTAGGEAAGYVSVERQDERLFHLQKIYLLPRYQGFGLGERLFRQAVSYVRAMGPTPCRMELNVNRYNRALHFYEHMGMRRLREGDFPIGGGFYMNDYIMGLDIE